MIETKKDQTPAVPEVDITESVMSTLGCMSLYATYAPIYEAVVKEARVRVRQGDMTNGDAQAAIDVCWDMAAVIDAWRKAS